MRNGPSWLTVPATVSCREACERLFSDPTSSPVDWQCSSQEEDLDCRASVSVYAQAVCGDPVDDDLRRSNLYDAPGAASAFVSDYCLERVNHCFRRLVVGDSDFDGVVDDATLYEEMKIVRARPHARCALTHPFSLPK